MRRFITADGSTTLYSDKYKGYYHSKSGAIEEAFEKYAKPCNIKPGMVILDIGFGLGYNSLAALHVAQRISVIALEKDKEVLEELQNIEVPEYLKEEYEIVKEAAKNLFYKDKDREIRIFLGDATKTIRFLHETFDAVFLDPFSLSDNTELWALDFFQEIIKRMNKNSVLATYSCARMVRDNLRKAGFVVDDGPVVGDRRPSTLARKL